MIKKNYNLSKLEIANFFLEIFIVDKILKNKSIKSKRKIFLKYK